MTTTDVLVSAADLARALDGPDPVRVLDVRWKLGVPDGRPEFELGHIPGAVYVDLEGELAAHGRPATEGRHPLPDVDDLQAAARAWGIDDRGDDVVVVDDLGGMSAARAWWLLKHAGLTRVRILDGGLGAWRDAGLPLETAVAHPDAGRVTLEYGHMPVLTIDEAAALPASGVLLDARAGERFRGEVEPVDPRAGHVPGAVSAPTSDNLGEGARFRDPDALRARFAEVGVTAGTTVGVYCGSGVTAAHEVAALAVAGIDAALFPGSWSAWSNDDERPVATGA
jgi:thiosulfate/3-mercaptopyruvate sulfurtransferase